MNSFTLHFASNPKYEALSCTWGPPEPVKTITINGYEVKVRENLYWALVNLQRGVTHRLFWVDAICINQDDLEERNRQVSLMAFIYSRAQAVLVWLGRLIFPPDDIVSHNTRLERLCHVQYWSLSK